MGFKIGFKAFKAFQEASKTAEELKGEAFHGVSGGFQEASVDFRRGSQEF